MTGPAAAVVRAPFTGRARRELLFCVLGLPLSLPLPVVGFAVTIWLAQVAGPPWTADGNPSWLALLTAAAVVVLTTVLMVATGLTRALAAATRRAAGKLLGEHVATPPRARTRLGDGPGWRAMAYLLLKLPAGLAEWYVVGVAMLLAAPWVTGAVVAADRWLLRGLLGPGRLTQRVHDLEQTRALAVEDAAARLRRLERDLHDGAQIRLATLAMNLGMARKKLGDAGVVPDLTAARELVGAAHQNAKDALVELRELARGIHPPVLDNGLADALASLTATSAIPAELAVSVPVRPTPAIETIAYFCAAELLANAAKHSRRTRSRS